MTYLYLFLKGKYVTICKYLRMESKVFQKNADIEIVTGNSQTQERIMNMRIENEMLSRFSSLDKTESVEKNLSTELDFFFDNVMDTVVEYFTEREELTV